MKKLSILEYLKFDNAMRADTRRDRINFAKHLGFKYYTEMLHVKHVDDGMSVTSISRWIKNANTEDHKLTATPSSIDYTLKSMGVFQYQNKKKNVVKLSEDLCTCCGTKARDPRFRFLCFNCWRDHSVVDEYNCHYA